MGRTYAARDAEKSANIRDLIAALKREGVDVLRHQLDARYTGYDVLLCCQRDHVHWHMIAIPNDDAVSMALIRWIGQRNGSVLISNSITSILSWIGVES